MQSTTVRLRGQFIDDFRNLYFGFENYFEQVVKTRRVAVFPDSVDGEKYIDAGLVEWDGEYLSPTELGYTLLDFLFL